MEYSLAIGVEGQEYEISNKRFTLWRLMGTVSRVEIYNIDM